MRREPLKFKMFHGWPLAIISFISVLGIVVGTIWFTSGRVSETQRSAISGTTGERLSASAIIRQSIQPDLTTLPPLTSASTEATPTQSNTNTATLGSTTNLPTKSTPSNTQTESTKLSKNERYMEGTGIHWTPLVPAPSTKLSVGDAEQAVKNYGFLQPVDQPQSAELATMTDTSSGTAAQDGSINLSFVDITTWVLTYPGSQVISGSFGGTPPPPVDSSKCHYWFFIDASSGRIVGLTEGCADPLVGN